MPGICGFGGSAGLLDPSSQLAAMLKPLRRHPWHRASCFTDNVEVGLGSVVLSDLQRDPHPAKSQDQHMQLVLDGELYDIESLRRKLGALGCETQTQNHAELLLHAYQTCGFRLLSELHGSFAAAIWDASIGLVV